MYGQPLQADPNAAYGAAAEAAPFAAAGGPEPEGITTGGVFKRDDERLSKIKETVRSPPVPCTGAARHSRCLPMQLESEPCWPELSSVAYRRVGSLRRPRLGGCASHALDARSIRRGLSC